MSTSCSLLEEMHESISDPFLMMMYLNGQVEESQKRVEKCTKQLENAKANLEYWTMLRDTVKANSKSNPPI